MGLIGGLVGGLVLLSAAVVSYFPFAMVKKLDAKHSSRNGFSAV